MQGEHWRPTYNRGRFLTMTCAFPHPKDRGVGKVSAATEKRFDEDGRRFPMPHYVENNMLEHRGRMIPVSADDREVLHGFPKGFGRKLHGKGDEPQEDARCRAIGQGFHIPSVMLVLVLLLNLPVQAMGFSTRPETGSVSITRLD